jgi:hypothetical protein
MAIVTSVPLSICSLPLLYPFVSAHPRASLAYQSSAAVVSLRGTAAVTSDLRKWRISHHGSRIPYLDYKVRVTSTVFAG